MHKKNEINQTKIKGRCQSGRKVITHDSKSDLPLGVERSTHAAAQPIIAKCLLAMSYLLAKPTASLTT